jgi:hypothetical protein
MVCEATAADAERAVRVRPETLDFWRSQLQTAKASASRINPSATTTSIRSDLLTALLALAGANPQRAAEDVMAISQVLNEEAA